MRHSPRFTIDDPLEIKHIVHTNAWATFISPASTGLVASHYPVILDDDAPDDEIVIISHFGRPDEVTHELGQHEILVIIQGPNDYISSSWYRPGDIIPTWNHVTVHLYGTPEILSDDENYAMLEKLTDQFESHYPGGRSLSQDEEGSRRIAKGTVGLRMRVDRFDARAKLSQNKQPDVVETITTHLTESNPALAAEMRRVHGGAQPSADGDADADGEVLGSGASGSLG